jgi:protein SCO1
MDRREFLHGGAAATAALGTAAAALANPPDAKMSAALARRRARFANVELRTHEGQAVRFYDDLLKDKTVLISFMYTSCTDRCPLTTMNLVQAQRLLGARVGRDLFLYSISVDPGHDTPAVLRDYTRQHGVGPGWLFLTGTPEDIRVLRRTFGDDPSLEFSQSQHLNLLSYGIEPLERWTGFPSWTQPETLVRYLAWSDPQGDRPKPGWPRGYGSSGG